MILHRPEKEFWTEWTVRTDSKEVLEKDTLARVIRISGVKLIVEPYKED